MANLYVVATPIGNLDDISIRAVNVLRKCSCVACEDTRRGRILLSHLGIHTATISCRSYNSAKCVLRILQMLGENKDVAYICDAGTPSISDPGAALVRAARKENHVVIPIPGASALTCLLSVSGITSRGWTFEGFLPPKGRKRLVRISELAERKEPFILYEAPHRIVRLFQELRKWEHYGIVIGRELTKMYEQIEVGTVASIANMLYNGKIPVKGEFIVVVYHEETY